jgi:hypothetical protein
MSDGGVTRVDLPSGGWVVMKNPRHVSVRGRKPVVALMSKMDDVGAESIDELLCVGGATLIAQWSFAEPITADTIADVITVEDADVLMRELLPLTVKLAPSFSPDGAVDPASPTPA